MLRSIPRCGPRVRFSARPKGNMATHPVEPEPAAPAPEPAAPNPTRLPVEPEFGPQLPPAEPEDPGVKPPTI
jgi:hypothetical protein